MKLLNRIGLSVTLAAVVSYSYADVAATWMSQSFYNQPSLPQTMPYIYANGNQQWPIKVTFPNKYDVSQLTYSTAVNPTSTPIGSATIKGDDLLSSTFNGYALGNYSFLYKIYDQARENGSIHQPIEESLLKLSSVNNNTKSAILYFSSNRSDLRSLRTTTANIRICTPDGKCSNPKQIQINQTPSEAQESVQLYFENIPFSDGDSSGSSLILQGAGFKTHINGKEVSYPVKVKSLEILDSADKTLYTSSKPSASSGTLGNDYDYSFTDNKTSKSKTYNGFSQHYSITEGLAATQPKIDLYAQAKNNFLICDGDALSTLDPFKLYWEYLTDNFNPGSGVKSSQSCTANYVYQQFPVSRINGWLTPSYDPYTYMSNQLNQSLSKYYVDGGINPGVNTFTFVITDIFGNKITKTWTPKFVMGETGLRYLANEL